MGWFWADSPEAVLQASHVTRPSFPANPSPSSAPLSSPSTCPVDHLTPPQQSACPVPHDKRNSILGRHNRSKAEAHQTQQHDAPSTGFLSKLNPLNNMFHDLSQERAPNQQYTLPTTREPSTIPKGSGSGNWEYPSPQQMYHALLRKGHTDTDVTAVESMVSIHNFLNEGAWNEIVGWERRYADGLARGASICSWGEENFEKVIDANIYPKNAGTKEPRLIRFQGRPQDLTPKALMLQALGRVLPKTFGTEPPFDRHDWYVSRAVDGKEETVRYVIDYYAGPPEGGMPVFYLDVRPAFTPRGAMERVFRWGGDVWWRSTGGVARNDLDSLTKQTTPSS